jgi:hypothetical protein
MAAHPYPTDATSWLLKALGFMTQFRMILTPAWLHRCEGAAVLPLCFLASNSCRDSCFFWTVAAIGLVAEDGSTAVEKQRPSLPMCVGTTTSFRVIGDVPVTAATTLGDVRRIIDTNPEFEAFLPHKYVAGCVVASDFGCQLDVPPGAGT